MFLRQGDVGLMKVGALPSDAKEEKATNDPVILAYGESTGHKHALREPQKVRVWNAEAERFIQVLEQTALTHEEHGAINLAPGVYRVIHQREYHPEELRLVAD